ncbi:MAG TPA: AlkA N-terminal domain-containing protein [Aliidongia sp.]|uniref:DNA-3-methyladenine glycosylase family protein n=1 Tax=Aliidongia sp. TaxID=1914230 RepID=UPI002DDD4113|nr:AlkA N-terminal domain-containing protein [Aliidongia sp.]HEV2675952.1 AlkA N-terminal domain-containing protein [Aliidongia sp.]
MNASPIVRLALPVHHPFDWSIIAGFLAPRCIPGVEAVDGLAYRRTILLNGRHGTIELGPGADGLEVAIRYPDATAHAAIAERLVRQFDLMTDIAAIAIQFGRDPLLAPLVALRPGLRVPGAWDPFELAVRAILGQQVSVAAATTLAGRVALSYGAPLQLEDGEPPPPGLFQVFPDPAALIGADPGVLRIPTKRAETIAGLARAALAEPALLMGGLPLGLLVERLDALPGIGPWTAHYIAMRALREPDAFPSGDLGLRKAMITAAGLPSFKEMDLRAEAWRPWRAYAALHLWMSLGGATGG